MDADRQLLLNKCIHPLSDASLGLLVRAYVLSHPSKRAEDAHQLLTVAEMTSPSVAQLVEIYQKLEQHFPELLGGPPPSSRDIASSSIVVGSEVEECVDCMSTLRVEETTDVRAFVFSQGWVSVHYAPSRCECCHCVYSSGWKLSSKKVSTGLSVVHPGTMDFFQIVATPKKGSKMFIDGKTMLFLRRCICCIQHHDFGIRFVSCDVVCQA